MAHPELAAAVHTASTPFGVNHLAQVAALACREPDAEHALRERDNAVVAERYQLITGLRGQGWTVPDAQGNFVWLATGERTVELAVAAAAEGVLVRPFAGEGLRITVGTPEAQDRVLALTAGWR